MRARTSIAEVPEKANEQHYEVCRVRDVCVNMLTQGKLQGADRVYCFDAWTICQILLMPLPNWQRDHRRSRNPDDGKLLRKGPTEGWDGHS